MYSAVVMLVVVLVVGLAVIALVTGLWWRAARTTMPADDRLLEALDVPDTDATRVLLGRWLDRSRRWRGAVTIPAVVFAALAALVLRGEITFGLLDTVAVAPLWSDALVVGLLGAALGAFGAELHHLRPRPSGPRAAGLRPRNVAALRRPLARVRRIALVVVGLGALVLHAVAVDAGHTRGLPWAGIAALVVLAGCELVERRVALRPRPALPPDLDRADDAVRRLAVRSVDDAASGAAILLTGWSAMGTCGVLPDSMVVDTVLVLGALTVLGCAIWWAWRSRPRTLVAEVTGRSTWWT